MKIVIQGREYDGTAQPFIGDLRLLKPEFGFGWGTVAERLGKASTTEDFLEGLSDGEFIDALVAWLWMARLRGGDRDCTRQDIELLPLDGLTFVSDDEPDEDDADPTSAPTASDRGDGNEATPAPRTRATTRTSSKRSSRG